MDFSTDSFVLRFYLQRNVRAAFFVAAAIGEVPDSTRTISLDFGLFLPHFLYPSSSQSLSLSLAQSFAVELSR